MFTSRHTILRTIVSAPVASAARPPAFHGRCIRARLGRLSATTAFREGLLAFSAIALLLVPPAIASDQYSQAKSAKEAPAQAVVEVAKSEQYGQYLTDAEGRALYMFVADKGKDGSTCYEACATAWPPYTTKEPPKAGDPAVQQKLLGTIKRRDGAMQVTYGGWPLYYYVRDAGPGKTTGQDVKGFGAEWYLIAPSGEPIRKH